MEKQIAKSKEKVLVILGPTATGKSHCAIEIAKKFRGEIISGDSMLVYRSMNIGTAKPTAEELAAVPHHLVNILPPEANFSVVDFKEQAQNLIHQINERGHLPIIAGGTGLYIKALLEDYAFNNVEENSELRQKLMLEAQTQGAEALHARLSALDAAAAERIHPHNVRRVVRALEAALQGEAINQYGAPEMPYDAVVIGLEMERQALYARINRRVDLMLEAGLEREVRDLLNSGVNPDCQSMQSIGYRQMVWYLNGSMPYAQAVEKIKQATRNFAKRQITWYKKMPYICWLPLEAQPNYANTIGRICEILVEKGILL
ncbi:tRNA (adenosine(37)-N6)-dimethylallyltransferase MiaA [uncultured Phascolarctobacterium sp.]|uniref:tRNA (adenosine(37)-N6)-dimethylallyltransferase MiaA n=1 Tax=uncultured Phascolarctobacterium sp. TaxID=512296 RepID=UPI00260AEF4F|nr:tRNA (adenosine(37)-N6)-dimethylallyltransferase MiaA [uncultured Phascolarctobacterium sp.]